MAGDGSKLIIEQMFEVSGSSQTQTAPVGARLARSLPAQRRDTEMSALVGEAVVSGIVASNVVVGDCLVDAVVVDGSAGGSGVRRVADAVGATRAIVMQSTPVESGVRHLVFEQASAGRAPAEESATSWSVAVDRRSARRRRMQLGPKARPARLRAPGARPAQPSPPLVTPTVWVARSSVTTMAAVRVSGRSRADEWELSSRGLVVMMVGFMLAVLCGLVVGVGALLSVSSAPLPADAAGSVAVVARAAV